MLLSDDGSQCRPHVQLRRDILQACNRRSGNFCRLVRTLHDVHVRGFVAYAARRGPYARAIQRPVALHRSICPERRGSLSDGDDVDAVGILCRRRAPRSIDSIPALHELSDADKPLVPYRHGTDDRNMRCRFRSRRNDIQPLWEDGSSENGDGGWHIMYSGA